MSDLLWDCLRSGEPDARRHWDDEREPAKSTGPGRNVRKKYAGLGGGGRYGPFAVLVVPNKHLICCLFISLNGTDTSGTSNGQGSGSLVLFFRFLAASTCKFRYVG